jgi:hypothetical protein
VTVSGWEQYQEEIAAYLARLGFETKTNETLRGVRGTHKIDVTARYTKAGLSQLWIVECKFWKRNRAIPKEKVETLLSIVSDVGADRGLLVTEYGFQSGAMAAARQTNVTLVTFDELRASSANELRALRVRNIADQVSDLLGRLDDLVIRSRPVENYRDLVVLDYPPGVDGKWVGGVKGWLLERRDALDHEAKRNKVPLHCGSLIGDNSLVLVARNMDEWLEYTEQGLELAGRVVTHLEEIAHS